MISRALFTSGLVAILTGGGCLGSAPSDSTDMGPDPTAEFNAKVAPILGGADGRSGSCGGCHALPGNAKGPSFMLPMPDMVTTLLASPGLVGRTAESSRLYMKLDHEGPGLTPQERPIVGDWIKLYNQVHAATAREAPKAQVRPFAPVMGANVIDLGGLDPALATQKLTFTARMVGSSLELTALTVEAAATVGVHIVHPLFVTWDAQMSPTPDPVDSFAGLDQTVYAGAKQPLGPGTLILPGFAAGTSLNVVFTAIEAKSGTAAGAAGATGCKNVALFTQTVQPTLVASCAGCHDGRGGGPSFMPMVGDPSAAAQAAACAGVRGEVNVTTPPMSAIYTYTDPASGVQHPFKFPAKSTFADVWIAAEK